MKCAIEILWLGFLKHTNIQNLYYSYALTEKSHLKILTSKWKMYWKESIGKRHDVKETERNGPRKVSKLQRCYQWVYTAKYNTYKNGVYKEKVKNVFNAG